MKDWCLWTVVLEKSSESPLVSKEIKPVNLKGNQPWILTGRTNAKAETPIFWSSNVNSWLTGKVPGTKKDWGQKKRASQDETAWWHHWYSEHEIGQTLGNGKGQGGLACYSSWGHKESDMTGWLNNNMLLLLSTASIYFLTVFKIRLNNHLFSIESFICNVWFLLLTNSLNIKWK